MRGYALGTAAGLAAWLFFDGDPVLGLFSAYICLLGRVVLATPDHTAERGEL